MARSILLLLCLFAGLTTEDRRRNGRLGAYVRLSQTPDRSEMTRAARANGPANLEWHERKVDPEGKLPPGQRRQMAEAARRLFYLQMAEKSRRVRAALKNQATEEQA